MGRPRPRHMGQRVRLPEQALQAHRWPQAGNTMSGSREKHTTQVGRPSGAASPSPAPAAAPGSPSSSPRAARAAACSRRARSIRSLQREGGGARQGD